ncbi:MAG TPA: metal-dependent hydrolase [Chitinophagaceae bacterium]|nr:metal-dependent hydrolase [Chitinophagaceae bacterium]
MDTLTHIALGACIGDALLGKKLGKRAMLLGAVAQSLPDIDFMASLWMKPPASLLAHRGFTHSILFCCIMAYVLALVAEYIHRPHNIKMRRWVIFFGVELFIHIFIDAFNNYGVGWFEPFSHYRLSFNAIYVADPFFSLWPGIAFVVLLVLKKGAKRRGFWWRFGVLLPAFYLAYCLYNKATVAHDVDKAFAAQHIPHERYFTTPAPLQNWLWYVVAGNNSGYYVGYRSVFDSKPAIEFTFFPRNDSLLKGAPNSEDVARLIRFSQQFYTLEKWSDTLVFNDLRFGQETGWQNPHEKFVFHYFLQRGADNLLVVQRGRFEGWNWEIFKSLVNRLEGN